MSTESTQLSEWVDANNPAYSEAEHKRDVLAGYNDSYSELIESGEITIDDFRDVTTQFLAERQAAAINKLTQLYDEIDFRGLASIESEILRKMYALEQSMAGMEEEVVMFKKLVEEEKAKIVARLPDLEDDIDAIGHEIAEKMATGKMSEYVAAEKEINDEAKAFATFFEEHGQAWPIPVIPRVDIDDATELYAEIDEETVIIDTYPEEKVPTVGEIVEDIKRRKPEVVIREASTLLAFVLAMTPNRSFTYDELGSEFYPDEVDNGSNRISALLSQYELGKVSIVGDIIEGEGLVLQRGKRHRYVRETGQKQGGFRCVLRTVKPAEADKRVAIVHGEGIESWMDDAWETIIVKDPRKVAEGEGEAGEVVLIKTPVEIQTTADSPNVEVHVGRNDADRTVPGSGDAILDQSTSTLTIEHPVVDEPEKKRGRKKEPKWMPEYRALVANAIDVFDRAGLMVGTGPLRRATVRNRTDSAMVGTQEYTERGIKMGVIKRSQVEDDELTLTDHIVLSILPRAANIGGNILGNKRTRKLAFSTAQTMVRERIASKK